VLTFEIENKIQLEPAHHPTSVTIELQAKLLRISLYLGQDDFNVQQVMYNFVDCLIAHIFH